MALIGYKGYLPPIIQDRKKTVFSFSEAGISI